MQSSLCLYRLEIFDEQGEHAFVLGLNLDDSDNFL